MFGVLEWYKRKGDPLNGINGKGEIPDKQCTKKQ